MGERRKPAEGAKLSGAVKSGTIRGHDSGESRNGNAIQQFSGTGAEGARKLTRLSYLSGKRTEKDFRMFPVILICELISGAVGDKFFILYPWRRNHESGVVE